ncbi:HupE / UreJ protein [Microbulbifer aggregans]|uniref:HupE / UreJ protein n=1 Tax=Microbulbifer aggregans TaxID=1769779 RepID=A0A1C9W799_9GAMM|nr:HupE/UreJ family protein [Microbulbifer aggregans]AOS97023.1 HupE / UreJ protein [Microbulbifer aggregans]
MNRLSPLHVTLIFAVLSLLLAFQAKSHELRPAYLKIEQTAEESFSVAWRVPARGDLRLSLNVKFDKSVSPVTPPRGAFASSFYTETWQISHSDSLADVRVTIDGLQQTMTDALVHIQWLDGREQVARLMPDQTTLVVETRGSGSQIAATYFTLGVEHILLGIDHLLFVLALVLLVSGLRQLVWTITAFTLAHSLTLAAAVLGWVSVPQAPVEAIIALSIVFVASEILHKVRGRSTLAIRKPWLVAFGFGLLHGLGFAGALTEIGVPQHAIPLSLALFNIGVEAGQLAFITTLAALWWLARQVPPVKLWEASQSASATAVVAWPTSYLVGGLAAWWLLDRSLSLVLL